ncbi:MAG TPA: beta-galactosidase, partial [Candidatus Merdenecus merdavium]|nr:beta-galactosidase [Candidatus Merdenecus merdavium]
MRIGTDYYPEHWERSRWKEDARLMRKAGIEVIRVGEFSWSLFEPEEGVYDFAWMDEAIEYFGGHGISIVLGTPSATPPKWMVDKYPEILPEDVHGQKKLFGTRRHYCFNSAVYRKKIKKLVELLAKRYGEHPHIEGWQIDNELGHGNTTHCYCEECRQKFIFWLKEKYQTIEQLNDTYGTVFWSQIYNNFEQIILPKAGACY